MAGGNSGCFNIYFEKRRAQLFARLLTIVDDLVIRSSRREVVDVRAAILGRDRVSRRLRLLINERTVKTGEQITEKARSAGVYILKKIAPFIGN